MSPAIERNGAFRTYTGRTVRYLDPRPEDIAIEDIARGLAMKCRWNGHLHRFYSVAEHSLRVAAIVSPANRLWALLHDAAEAYLNDIPKPLKELPEMAPYREAEARMMRAICERFLLPFEEPEEVRRADRWMLGIEARDLFGADHREWIAVAHWNLVPGYELGGTLSWGVAELHFLNLFEQWKPRVAACA